MSLSLSAAFCQGRFPLCRFLHQLMLVLLLTNVNPISTSSDGAVGAGADGAGADGAKVNAYPVDPGGIGGSSELVIQRRQQCFGEDRSPPIPSCTAMVMMVVVAMVMAMMVMMVMAVLLMMVMVVMMELMIMMMLLMVTVVVMVLMMMAIMVMLVMVLIYPVACGGRQCIAAHSWSRRCLIWMDM